MAAAAVQLSVVIAGCDCRTVIGQCLDALAAQDHRPAMEIILAVGSTDGTDNFIRERYPQVTLLHFDAPVPLPVLRGHAIAATRGAVIAILDPYSVAAPDWAAAVVDAHRRSAHSVIGGLVDIYQPSRRRWLEWTIYFNEYGLFMPPGRTGTATIVPGSNVSYKRTALFDSERARYPVFWKTFANWDVESRGEPLWLDARIQVALNKPIPYRDFLRSRYDHGRCFAGMRVAHSSRFERLCRAAAAPAVAPLLLARWTAGFWPKRRRRARYLLSLPAQLLLFCVWAYGEFRGYLNGPGNTCNKLFY